MADRKMQEQPFSTLLSLVVLSSIIAGIVGYGIASVVADINAFPIFLQHIYEGTAVLGGGLAAVVILEGIRDNEEIIDDFEFGLYLTILTILLLFPLPAIGDAIAKPIIPLSQIPLQFSMSIVALAVIETSIAVSIIYLLERYTELI